MNWQPVSKEWPPKGTSFAITYHGDWVKATRGTGNKEVITVEWLGKRFRIPLSELQREYWLPIQPPPTYEVRYADYIEAKIAGELD